MVDLNIVKCTCGMWDIPSHETRDIFGIVHSSTYPCYNLLESIKDSKMEFTTFVRKPFVVEAVEITPENIEGVAKYVGDLREKDDGTPYILVDRRLVPNVFRVYPGFFMTKMGENIRCYSRKIFTDQFMEKDETIQPWLDFLEGGE